MMNEDESKIDFSEYEDVGDELLAQAGGAINGVTLPDDMHPLARSIIYFVDGFSDWQGRLACLLFVPIIFGMFYEVVARNLFTAPTLWSYDLSRMLAGMSFMLGAAYTLMRGLHIRADFLYRNFKPKTQGTVDLILYIVLFMPAMLFFLKAGYDFSEKSFFQNERAGDSTWAPVVWPVKMALTAGILFLVIQGISEILKSWYAATRGKWPI